MIANNYYQAMTKELKIQRHMRKALLLGLMLLSITVSAQTQRALLIGISDYGTPVGNSREEQWENIHGFNDVEILAPTLKKSGFRVTTVTNNNATAKRIRKELKSLVRLCRKGDVIYLHFSCHGQPFEDLNGDEEDGWDESIIPYDAQKAFRKGKYEGANHILDDELSEYFEQIRTKVGVDGLLCVVIDACHAGGSSRGEELEEDEGIFVRGTKDAFSPSGKKYRPRVNTKGHFVIKDSNTQGAVIIFEACRSYQSNYEIKQNGKYYGPLSFYVNQALQNIRIAPNLNLVRDVKRRMDGDRRLTRQNMVYETSLK